MKPLPLSVQTIDYCNTRGIDAIKLARWMNAIKTELKRINHKKTLNK